MDDPLDEQSKRIQDAIDQTDKKMRIEHFHSPEGQAEYEEFEADMMAWETAMETAPYVTVYKYIGEPEIAAPEDVPDEQIEAELDRVLETLIAYNISPDFIGEWSDREAYECIYTRLLKEEIEEVYHAKWVSHFTYATPRSEMETWLNDFLRELFRGDDEYPPITMSEDEWYDAEGHPTTKEAMLEKVHAFWRIKPAQKRFRYEIVSMDVNQTGGTATIDLFWNRADGVRKIRATFRMQPIPNEVWEVIQTDLLDLLLKENSV